MKLKSLVIASCAISVGLLGSFGVLSGLCLSACKKGGENDCGSLGGIVSPNRYLFWIDHNFGCGAITVEIKDANGKIITPFQGTISYTSAAAPECNNVNYGKYATFDLYQGKTYTYKAVCTGKSWAGTIAVPCEQSQCKTLQLQ